MIMQKAEKGINEPVQHRNRIKQTRKRKSRLFITVNLVLHGDMRSDITQ